MDFIIKFAQAHETFRVAEIQALAVIEGIELEILEYNNESPLCLVKLRTEKDAEKLIRRSILAQSVHELWGMGQTLDLLHQSVKNQTSKRWRDYKTTSFKFTIDSYQGAHSNQERLSIINTFDYLPFEGPIRMSQPEETFTVFELWPFNSVPLGIETPDMLYLGRLVGKSSRETVLKFDLKKRGYISTTSMDSELALITANIALAGPGKLFYDPFVGTGSFPIACACFGAMGWGSDIDGRSIRGEGGAKSLRGNFKQYKLDSQLGDVFAADLTNTPIKTDRRIWDGIVCDPPYGVREGLRVLGLRDPQKSPWLIEQGKKDAASPDFVPPKKPYSFLAMLDDILAFAAATLVDRGRLSFWMPTANDEDQEIPVPTHPSLELVVICVQKFNKWSRRLITYSRLPDEMVSAEALTKYENRVVRRTTGTTVDDLNPFRRGYFKKFDLERQQN
ncbi:tRNA guanosine-2'-O-methyltransferase TRM11 [Pochonia chlamydosporia 170]|uniref:tRNA (guanine(10)-N(2))-methyltransferase n=1 Tax=Pochonia chlamydosporia 170 TaxID=1380566 RepID=A0A179FFF8_METCM|nr:tRNA guanosine-2'-O-methyltransferase TRM11 [Pochonia chlamydosporia 170]OAQ64137.1 tRNA guanosine-2'-O-methyltransferase TRM11 [Pochonia chlamydosporia 170]